MQDFRLKYSLNNNAAVVCSFFLFFLFLLFPLFLLFFPLFSSRDLQRRISRRDIDRERQRQL